MIQEQLITFSFCKIHGWSILIQSFAKFIMGDTYVDAKTVLDSVKSSTWKFFKFRMSGGEIDKNYAFCRFCLDDGKAGKMGKIKFCGGTTNMTNHLKACHKEEAKSLLKLSMKEEGNKQSILDHFVATTDKAVTKWPKSSQKWKEVTMGLAKWFCKSSRPTAMVSDPGFHAFLALACPEYDPPSQSTITKYIRSLYEVKKKQLTERLAEIEFCAVTTDGGTSSDATSFQV